MKGFPLGTDWIDIAGMPGDGEVKEIFAVDEIHFKPNTHIRIAGKIIEHLGSR